MKKIILIDGNSIMYRAYYALAYTGNLMHNSKGVYTNAIYAFINMTNKILETDFDNILVAFDAGKKTFRHDLVDTYKGGRSPMPEELRMQIPYIKKYLDLSGIKRYELPMYEADDIIGTMARLSVEEGYHVDIYSSDKDLLQLVNDNVILHMPRKGITQIENYDKEAIVAKYGLTNNQMIDLKALMGDASDNLKGIPGVGEKTAIKLLKDYDTLEAIIEGMNYIKGKLGEKIRTSYKDAIICKKMVTIDQFSPIKITFADTAYNNTDDEGIKKLYTELEFHSLLKRKQNEQTKKFIKRDIKYSNLNEEITEDSVIVLETTLGNYNKAIILGMAIVNDKGSYFVKDLLSIKSFLENDKIKKDTFNYKKSIVMLNKQGIDLKGVEFDCLLGSYILDPKTAKKDLKVISLNFGYDDLEYDDVILKKSYEEIIKNDAYKLNAIKKAHAIKEMKPNMLGKIIEEKSLYLLNNVEMELAKVLASMEIEGIKISLEELMSQRKTLGKRIIDTEDKIYMIAGKEFNIASPKQLGELLFEDLNLPHSKKTKTGFSTNSEVLMSLYDSHEIIKYVLEYRKIAKLYNTYIEGIKNVIREDGKVHTIFEQAITETGRLSSIEPNLQNIPIRTQEGAGIRKIFIPSYDYLLSADYSQIELRILAHIAKATNLIKAFNDEEDIHENTAKAVFKKDIVSSSERQAAKAVNFGIVYGISPWGLSNDLHISINEATNFINSYFENYPEVKKYMDKVVNDATINKYTETIMHRRRYIRELDSKNHNVREFGKRTAMNAPIQGSAADIIKKAMVLLYKQMKKLNLKSKMIVQVHDELIFDCVKEEIDIMNKIVKETMEKAYDLSVPLLVNVGYGKSWFEAK